MALVTADEHAQVEDYSRILGSLADLDRRGLADVIAPDHIGLFGLTFEVDNLSELQEKVTAAGYPVKYGPVDMEIPERGLTRSLVIAGPNQAWLEFFERV